MIDELQLYIPRSNDGWFYVKMMSDPETMAYNAPWFPPDGCIPDRRGPGVLDAGGIRNGGDRIYQDERWRHA